jgi:transposase-like protein
MDKMSEQSTALVPRRHWTKEERRIRRFQYPTPGRKGYPPSTKRRIIELLETTNHSIFEICAMPGMPDHSTVWDWMKSDTEFGSSYENAKRVRAARMVEQAISDVERCGDNDLQFAKVMDAKARIRFKAAALFDPARYSEAMSGALNRLPSGNQVQVVINIPGVAAEAVTVEAELGPLAKLSHKPAK